MVQGTGGIALYALQFGKLRGATRDRQLEERRQARRARARSAPTTSSTTRPCPSGRSGARSHRRLRRRPRARPRRHRDDGAIDPRRAPGRHDQRLQRARRAPGDRRAAALPARPQPPRARQQCRLARRARGDGRRDRSARAAPGDRTHRARSTPRSTPRRRCRRASSSARSACNSESPDHGLQRHPRRSRVPRRSARVAAASCEAARAPATRSS